MRPAVEVGSRARGGARSAWRRLIIGATFVEYMVLVALALGAVTAGVHTYGKSVTKGSDVLADHIRTGTPAGQVAQATKVDAILASFGAEGTITPGEMPGPDEEVDPDPNAVLTETHDVAADEHPTNYDKVKWKVVKGPIFVRGKGHADGVHPADVSQGQIGDCYFIASLATLAARRPQLIRTNVRSEGKGVYSVRLFIKGKWQWIRVNNKFPSAVWSYSKKEKKYVWSTNGDGPVFASPGQRAKSGPELWPMLFEAAFAKSKGGYNAIGHGGGVGRALTTLSGMASTSHSPDKMTFRKFAAYVKAGYAVIGGTVDDDDPRAKNKWFTSDRLATNHAYWVQSVDMKKQTVILRNPWGWSEGTIEIPWREFQKLFDQLDTNPLYRRKARR